jgi:hypothetical protein
MPFPDGYFGWVYLDTSPQYDQSSTSLASGTSGCPR